MQYVDSKWNERCHGIDYEDFKQSLTDELEKKKINNRQSVRSNFYNNYLTEELLVKKVNCGGYLEQPICIYDFTVKTMSHDCLNFSTRHMTHGGKSKFIDSNYIRKPVRPGRQKERDSLYSTQKTGRNTISRPFGGDNPDYSIMISSSKSPSRDLNHT